MEAVEDEHRLARGRDVAERPVRRLARIGRDRAGPHVRRGAGNHHRVDRRGRGARPDGVGFVRRDEAVVVELPGLESDRGGDGAGRRRAEVEDVVPARERVALVGKAVDGDETGGGNAGVFDRRGERRRRVGGQRRIHEPVGEGELVGRLGREIEVRVVGVAIDRLAVVLHGEELDERVLVDHLAVVAELRRRRAGAERLGVDVVDGLEAGHERELRGRAGGHVDVGAARLPEAVEAPRAQDEVRPVERDDGIGGLRREDVGVDRAGSGERRAVPRLEFAPDVERAAGHLLVERGRVAVHVSVNRVGDAGADDDAGVAGFHELVAEQLSAVLQDEPPLQADLVRIGRVVLVVDRAAVDDDVAVEERPGAAVLLQLRAVGNRDGGARLRDQVAAGDVGHDDARAVDDDVVAVEGVAGRRGRGSAVVVPVRDGEPEAVAGRAGPDVRAGVRLGAEQDRRERREGFRFHVSFPSGRVSA